MSTQVHGLSDLSVTPEPEDTPVRISIQGSLATVKINRLPGYLGFTNLSSMPCSDLGCWVSYEDTLLSTPRSEYRPSVPGCGGGAESHSPLAFGHSLLHWRRTDCYDDRAVSPNQREPGPRCPALRGLSALGLASGGARDGAGRVLPRRPV